MSSRKVALFTSVGSDLGVAARSLAANGYEVGILSNSEEDAALAEELSGVIVAGSNHSIVDLYKLVDLAMQKWSRIDVLVNSTGYGPMGSLLELSDEQWHLGLDDCFLSITRATRVVMPAMQDRKSGLIINYLNFSAFSSDPAFAASGVFEAGLTAFTRLFTDQYSSENIRMNNLVFGIADRLPENRQLNDCTPIEDQREPETTATTIAYLASEHGVHVAGQNIPTSSGSIHLSDLA